MPSLHTGFFIQLLHEDLDSDHFDYWSMIANLESRETCILFPDGHYVNRFHGMTAFHHARPIDNYALDSSAESPPQIKRTLTVIESNKFFKLTVPF